MKTLTLILALITADPEFAHEPCKEAECEEYVDFEGLYG